MKKLGTLVVLFVALTLSFTVSANQRIKALKEQIIKISYENITNEASQAEVRAELQKLTQEIESLAAAVTEQTWVMHAPGSWQQIWSDEADMSPPGSPKRDLAQIYQVVSKEGWAYNFGERKLSDSQTVTFALAALGSVKGNEQTTEITKAFFNPSPLTRGASLWEIAFQIHDGNSPIFQERQVGRFPNGPIGASGVLTIHFLDEDLKIGTTPNVYTGRVEMFVMKRVSTVQ